MSTASRFPRSLFLASGVLAVLALFTLVVGPVVTGQTIAVSASHSHVFLTREAATGHSHGGDRASELDSEVVNVGDHSADSTPGTVHLHGVAASAEPANLVTAFQVAGPNTEYSDPFSVTPELPPRIS